VKPFGIKELKARVHAHLRREDRKQTDVQRQAIRYGDLIIDLRGHRVTFQNEPIPITHREFAIIELLALHQGQVFNKEQIYEKVWGLDAMGDSSTVTEHEKKIRAKLSIIDSERQYISTIWGVGYKWGIVSTT
jgi:two-component system, OmpR family, lantibiotic biosynthesis response regulator NisR/SpaR